MFGYNDANNIGRVMENLISRNILTYLGPEFKTFITRAHATSLDIALGNRFAHLNITIEQEPISTSDHLPMYIRLATKPIATKGTKTLRMAKANWEEFANYLNTKMQHINSEENRRLTKEQIEKEIEKWITIVKEAINEAIPTSDITIMPYPKITKRQKQLMNRFRIIKQHINQHG